MCTQCASIIFCHTERWNYSFLIVYIIWKSFYEVPLSFCPFIHRITYSRKAVHSLRERTIVSGIPWCSWSTWVAILWTAPGTPYRQAYPHSSSLHWTCVSSSSAVQCAALVGKGHVKRVFPTRKVGGAIPGERRAQSDGDHYPLSSMTGGSGTPGGLK